MDQTVQWNLSIDVNSQLARGPVEPVYSGHCLLITALAYLRDLAALAVSTCRLSSCMSGSIVQALGDHCMTGPLVQ